MLKLTCVVAVVAVAVLAAACSDERVEPKGTPDYSSAAQLLAQTYAPALYLVSQVPPCDDTFDTDPYNPTSVDVFFGKSNVRLMSRHGLAKTAPMPADLPIDGNEYYLDIHSPSPRVTSDRCVYAGNYGSAGGANTVYARVVRTADETIVQYWLFYYINDWINVHEGDWELIQLLFPSGSPTDIVSLNVLPEWADYSQHTGGRRVPWELVQKVPVTGAGPGKQPIVYVGAGSHANYYEPGNWHAEIKYWFDNCDFTVSSTDPRARPLYPASYTLVPIGDPATDPSFAWTAFPGKWGEALRIPAFGGITFPLLENQGRNPWWWHDQLKEGLNDHDFCVDRELGQRPADAGERFLYNLETIEQNVLIAVGDVVVFFISWFGSDVSLTLISPFGDPIGPGDADIYEKGDVYVAYRLTNVDPGPWTLVMKGEDLPASGETVLWQAFDLPGACSEIDQGDSNRDSDLDGLPNDSDANPCSWDDDGDEIGDGCEAELILCTPTVIPPSDTPTAPPLAATPTPF
jgi:hypothetical protein